MARREKLRALVLSRRNVGEADRLVTMLTRERGLLRVLAKGVRKIPSRRGGHMESLTQVMVLVSGGSGRYFLQAVETENYFKSLHDDHEALARMQRLSKALIHIFEEEVAYTSLYDALLQACRVLPEVSYAKRSLMETAIALLALREGGIIPLLGKCRRCGRRRPEETVVLNAEQGGWTCLTCTSSMAKARASLAPRMLAVLRYLAIHPDKALRLSVSEEEARQLTDAVWSYVSTLVMREMAT